jgi:hypothetical protein
MLSMDRATGIGETYPVADEGGSHPHRVGGKSKGG